MTRARAAGVCSQPGCWRLRPCPEHVSKPWGGAKERRPSALSGRKLQQRNAEILAAHGGRCHVCGGPGADRVDHVVPLAEGGSEHPTNLAPIHDTPCHADKSAAESARGRARRRSGP